MKHLITMLLLVASLWAGVNINTASKEELAAVKGIGSKTAEAIISHREKQPFKSVSELTQVKGIGAKKLEKIQKDLEI